MKRESFIFYKSFYDSIKELEIEQQAKIYNAIFKYQFEEEEIELKGVNKSIFMLIKPLLNANNKRYENGKKGGRPKKIAETKTKPNENLTETKTKPNQKVMNNVLCIMNYELCIMNNEYYKNKNILVNKIKEWLEYKEQRKDKKYTEIGFNKLLKQIENNVNKYGEQQVIDLIDECMSNNYQGIIFDKLKNKKEEVKKYSDEWWDKV